MQNDSVNSGFKYSRVLQLYTKLMDGDVINKAQEAERFGKNMRSIQRDIDDLRAFFADRAAAGEIDKELVYDSNRNGYYLKTTDERTLTNSEIFAVCKILLESRAFCKSDITAILDKLLFNCVPKSKQHTVKELISNELYHYIEPRHGKHFINSMWEMAEAVNQKFYIKILYIKPDGTSSERVVKPVGIMFSEFYFYLMAFKGKCENNGNKPSPKFYRIDRIKKFEVLKEHFDIPYKDRFEEGELRKRVLFMYGGELKRIKFLYKGVNPEPVLDKLLTSKVIEKKDNGYVMTAEAFQKGLDMWVRSQGKWVEIINNI